MFDPGWGCLGSVMFSGFGYAVKMAAIRSLLTGLGLAPALAVLPQAAWAGPPFLTDDPAPTDTGHWEIYNFVAGTREGGETSADFGLDLNFGPVEDVQATLVVPLSREPGLPVALGDVELAAKLRVLRQDHGVPLSLTLFPRLVLPTGRDSHRLRMLLPVWAGRDFGKWSLFGGGGYTLNPGPGQRDFWQGGAVLARAIRPGWQLGLELFSQGAEALGERPLTVANLGTTVHIGGPVSLLGSFGQGLNRRASVFYSAIKLDL